MAKGLSKLAQALLAFLQEALPVYGTVNYQAARITGNTGNNPQTLGDGASQRYIWVHGSYAPRKLEGCPKLPSLMQAWSATNDGNFVTAIQELVAAKVAQQRAVKGGYVIALQSDLDALPATEKKSASTSGNLKDAARFLKARR